ncbi:PREDICTED: uncharacterized protein LOC102017617 [Chinchilla lanigera]|uniref:uncharacterized protein LOC102017617 n=1 Tax=Chinchilla lanigera TaxID=34839 RepID=UPI00038ED257|nr:PREDICTED: uncharacterized protein LOC102017617 [Chinchilla lanigera]
MPNGALEKINHRTVDFDPYASELQCGLGWVPHPVGASVPGLRAGWRAVGFFQITAPQPGSRRLKLGSAGEACGRHLVVETNTADSSLWETKPHNLQLVSLGVPWDQNFRFQLHPALLPLLTATPTSPFYQQLRCSFACGRNFLRAAGFIDAASCSPRLSPPLRTDTFLITSRESGPLHLPGLQPPFRMPWVPPVILFQHPETSLPEGHR